MDLSQLYCREALHLLDASMFKINHCLLRLSTDQIWWRPSENLNSIGNLMLHIAGNLRQWGVISFSGEADNRDRAAEFDARGGKSADELLAIVNQSILEAKTQIENLTSLQLSGEMIVQGFSTTGLGAITHTTSHFVGHTHQIIMLTRLQLGDAYEFEWSIDNRGSDASDVPL